MARLAAAVTLLSRPSPAKSAASGSPAPASSETVASVSAELIGCAAPYGPPDRLISTDSPDFGMYIDRRLGYKESLRR
jgi:hypothetical protein